MIIRFTGTLPPKTTDLCDYRLLATKGGQAHIARICLKSVAAWKQHPGMKNAVKEWVPLP